MSFGVDIGPGIEVFELGENSSMQAVKFVALTVFGRDVPLSGDVKDQKVGLNIYGDRSYLELEPAVTLLSIEIARSRNTIELTDIGLKISGFPEVMSYILARIGGDDEAELPKGYAAHKILVERPGFRVELDLIHATGMIIEFMRSKNVLSIGLLENPLSSNGSHSLDSSFAITADGQQLPAVQGEVAS